MFYTICTHTHCIPCLVCASRMYHHPQVIAVCLIHYCFQHTKFQLRHFTAQIHWVCLGVDNLDAVHSSFGQSLNFFSGVFGIVYQPCGMLYDVSISLVYCTCRMTTGGSENRTWSKYPRPRELARFDLVTKLDDVGIKITCASNGSHSILNG